MHIERTKTNQNHEEYLQLYAFLSVKTRIHDSKHPNVDQYK